jgi:hypothetical protein
LFVRRLFSRSDKKISYTNLLIFLISWLNKMILLYNRIVRHFSSLLKFLHSCFKSSIELKKNEKKIVGIDYFYHISSIAWRILLNFAVAITKNYKKFLKRSVFGN